MNVQCIFFICMANIRHVEVIKVAEQQKTNVQQVRRQNQAAAGGQQAEFAAETDAQQVRQQNQQAEAKKQQRQQ
ncbi:small, acid-soluble spore protein, gamma-type [Caldalkalibacillus thermarum TA2.A1]|uniref:Small, acid-soluble spore protein gamma-type n=2 Tax=Caldalkalibacillus thermarum (strain TA2.A1) TaxID=986075 RepID=F5L3L4_CALTT|nr:small, acid-soluble spore protein, gamma-type [Caldalkalibacillus thermarum TA2.A1]